VVLESSRDRGRQEELYLNLSRPRRPCHFIIASKILNRKVHTMIDSGASGLAFIDKSFARSYNIPLTQIQPQVLRVFDGRETVSGAVTHTARVSLNIYGHHEELEAYVTQLNGRHPLILGLPWLRLHLPSTDWHSLTFESEYCVRNCLKDALSPVRAPAIEDPPIKRLSPDLEPTLNIAMIGAAPFNLLAKRAGHEVFAVNLQDINKALKPPKSSTPEDIQRKLPQFHHEFTDVFSRQLATVLPPHRPYDHKIDLLPGYEDHGHGSLYGMSHDELRVLKKYLEENLATRAINVSTSRASSPVLFVKKPGGGLRLCVDYRKLNAITVKNRYPIPLIRETLTQLSRAKYYTKIDIIAAFNRLRITEGDEWKTAFRTRYGLFEYNVLPFGLSNGPSSFQRYINEALHEYLDVFCTAYMDDILIYSSTLTEHRQHVKQVLTRLRAAGLQADIDKSEFEVQEVIYLGLIISTDGIKMDPEKIKAIYSWETPKRLTDVQAFVGFANFYRRFIDHYSDVIRPLTALSKKDVKFSWSEQCEQAFRELKKRFTEAPILRHFDSLKPSIVETDASDFVTAGVLSQHDDQGILHPVAFFSKKNSPAECNYEIYDKELLAIVRAFEQWRPELEGNGSGVPIDVLTDHRNLEYYMTTKQLSRRQARWSEFLSRFNFVVKYRPGKLGAKPDALTRRSQDLPAGTDDERVKHQFQIVLKPHNLDTEIQPKASSLEIKAITRSDNEPQSSRQAYEELSQQHEDIRTGYGDSEQTEDLFTRIRQAYTTDKDLQRLLQGIKDGDRRIPGFHLSLSDCLVNKDGLAEYRGRLIVPDCDALRLQILQSCHDSPVAGHPGRAETHRLIARSFFWPRVTSDVDRYVRNCRICAKAKAPHTGYQGLLRSMPLPERRWKEVSVDFITGLPPSGTEGFNAIMMVVDRLTKMQHQIPCHKNIDARGAALLFVTYVWKIHGLPDFLTSDRDSRFTAEFWKHVCSRLGIKARMSTAFHPETDGQTERVNQGVEQYLRAFTSYLQEDWADFLPLAEFCVNNATSSATGVSPFFANYGQHPRIGFEPAQYSSQDSVSPRLQIERTAANEFADRMAKIEHFLQSEMQRTQAKQEDNANLNRRPAVAYKAGDIVFLSTKNLRTERPAQKIDWKAIGPYKILDVVSPYAYRLDLPGSLKIHPVFHTSLLTPAATNPFPGQVLDPPPPVVVNEQEEYEVRKILDSRIRHHGNSSRLEYLVQWTGYDKPDWEPATNVVNAPDLVAEYHEKHPSRPSRMDLSARTTDSNW
jgi:hypothetical protein